MKITAQVSGGSLITLALEGGFPLSCVSNFRLTAGIQVQEDQIVRSTLPFKAGRGNRVGPIWLR
jgi:hypothetical protein